MPDPTLSPAELSQLEHAFATDPNSEAYRPLAEAYLSMGRFMEAMVVCKKGVKAHPDRPDPRVLLARVYAVQNKDRKALDELEGAIQTAPQDAPALRMAASLLLKVGDNDKGKDYALRAFKAEPSDTETRDLLQKWKIEIPVEEPKPAPPVLLPPSVEELSDGVAFEEELAEPQAERAVAVQPAPAPRGDAAQAPRARPASRPAARPAPPRPQRPAVDLSRFEEPDEPVRHASSSGGMVTLGFAVLAVITLAGWWTYKRHKATQNAEISAAAHEAKEALAQDSYASYKKACDAAERILKIDPDSGSAHAYLAYAYAVRWGEHGEGESAHTQALDHEAQAKRLEQKKSPFLIAAEALIQFYSGKPDAAEASLEGEVASYEKKGVSNSLLYETLGIIEMRNGDLEKAGTHLKKALDLAQGDPRIHAAMGDLYRRQGQEMLAWNYYDNALRYEKDHADAVLGKALLALEAQNPDYKIAEELIKRVRDADPPPSPRQLAMAYLLDGMRLNQTGKKAEGLAQEQKALALDANNPEIHVLIGRRMLRDGQAEQGLAEIQKAIKLDPKRASFYVELARAQMELPDGAKDAVASLKTALKTLPGSAKLLTQLGDAYAKSGDVHNAQLTYEKALAQDPKAQLPAARLALADIARKNKDYSKAQKLYERAIQDYATNTLKVAEARTDEALMLQAQGADKVKVLTAFQDASKADPNYAPAYFFAAKFLATDRRAKAVVHQLADQYLKHDPKGPYAGEAARLRTLR